MFARAKGKNSFEDKTLKEGIDITLRGIGANGGGKKVKTNFFYRASERELQVSADAKGHPSRILKQPDVAEKGR